MDGQIQTSIYEKGLQFECTRCGKCCTGFPGFVYLSEPAVKLIADFLDETVERFLIKYTKTVSIFHENRLSLIEKSNYDCIFWDKICKIYPVRPYQCRSYPFWKKHLVSKREWDKAGRFCPGINRGKVHSKNAIDDLIRNVPDYNIENFFSHFEAE
jgi:Fe-S-cluster containining protein